MKLRGHPHQKGTTLIIGLIFLVVITLMVTTAFKLSSTNLKSVGNMQFRNEAIAAANKAVEQVISNNFTTGFFSLPPSQTITFDVNNDGTSDYSVAVAVPVCVQSSQSASSVAAGGGSSANLAGFSGTSNYSTLWEISATVTDALSGASVLIRQGMRMELTALQFAALCP